MEVEDRRLQEVFEEQVILWVHQDRFSREEEVMQDLDLRAAEEEAIMEVEEGRIRTPMVWDPVEGGQVMC
jgi:hypothetical protein